MQIVSNFAVNPNDEMYISVWVGDPRTGPDLKGPFGVFYILNEATNQLTVVTMDRGSTEVRGMEAEWIMEAPLYYDGFHADLANYASTIIFRAFASPVGSSGSWISYQADANAQVTMFNGVNKLSSVTPINYQAMRFTWHSFY